MYNQKQVYIVKPQNYNRFQQSQYSHIQWAESFFLQIRHHLDEKWFRRTFSSHFLCTNLFSSTFSIYLKFWIFPNNYFPIKWLAKHFEAFRNTKNVLCRKTLFRYVFQFVCIMLMICDAINLHAIWLKKKSNQIKSNKKLSFVLANK